MVRVVVIGARRRRQGIGEFAARWFQQAGAIVSGIVGTTDRTVEEARSVLRERYGIACRGYTSLAAALAAERPHIVAICSPYEHHRAQLEESAAYGAHCLCEKPLWWDSSPEKEAETARLVDLFARQEKLLALMTQWPYVLPAYYELYPELRGAGVERFEMALGPTSTGAAMAIDSAPHALSMLQALVGYGEVARVRAAHPGNDPRRLELAFEYRHDGGRVDVSLRLERCEAPPRPASFGINGALAERRILLPEYTMRLEGGGRSVPLEDPLGRLVEGFLDNVFRCAAVDRRGLVESMVGLERLVARASQGSRADTEDSFDG